MKLFGGDFLSLEMACKDNNNDNRGNLYIYPSHMDQFNVL